MTVFKGVVVGAFQQHRNGEMLAQAGIDAHGCVSVCQQLAADAFYLQRSGHFVKQKRPAVKRGAQIASLSFSIIMRRLHTGSAG